MSSVAAVKKLAPARLAGAAAFLLLASAAFLSFPAETAAAVPVKITYQGNLRQGGNLVTGQRNIVFRIYDSSEPAGALLCR